ncbi:hypothetical protein [Cerasicoccus fimbriatus]|uniref:hypothetical protein n=1 Tax=Cerasicoccus fimbriatus TaxID=3014554 RepID=UPI0022B57234|nr:hypothetical protein [Cerasicoccus sp. TK19100]
MKKLFLFAIALLSFAPASMMAQNDGTSRVRFSALSWTQLISDVYVRDAQGEKIPLWIPNGSPSKEYSFMGSKTVQFLREAGKDEEGNPIEKVVATYTPNPNQQKLLIFVENGNTGEYRILPINFSPADGGTNQYRFFNLSSFPVYVKFGDERFQIPTNGEKDVDVSLNAEGGMSIAMAIQVSEKPGDAKIAYSSVWTVRNGRSALIFVTTDLNQDERIDVKKMYF